MVTRLRSIRNKSVGLETIKAQETYDYLRVMMGGLRMGCQTREGADIRR